jgi:hypothetical protein
MNPSSPNTPKAPRKNGVARDGPEHEDAESFITSDGDDAKRGRGRGRWRRVHGPNTPKAPRKNGVARPIHSNRSLPWLSAQPPPPYGILYLGSRPPQLYKNYQRKSTEGLSPLLFMAAFCGP